MGILPLVSSREVVIFFWDYEEEGGFCVIQDRAGAVCAIYE